MKLRKESPTKAVSAIIAGIAKAAKETAINIKVRNKAPILQLKTRCLHNLKTC